MLPFFLSFFFSPFFAPPHAWFASAIPPPCTRRVLGVVGGCCWWVWLVGVGGTVRAVRVLWWVW